jgi:F-type H+-transporting ATPase subunit gamma
MSGKLKEVRERIGTVKSTQQITKAMKMVSAAKLRRAQQAIQQLRPYALKQDEMLRNILSNLEGDASTAYGTEREINRALIVVVTSSKGLCGAFNTNVIKAAIALMEGKYASLAEQGRLSLLCIGKKGYDFFRKQFDNNLIINDYVKLFNDLSFDNVSKVSAMLIDKFLHEEFDAIDVAYGRFKNAAVQFTESAPFLPVPKIEKEEDEEQSNLKADYIFEPDKTKLLDTLIPSILQTTFQRFLLDTHASEHGARMTAMDNATENAEELMRELKITYNKARQEAITKEISEIVGGAAALEG